MTRPLTRREAIAAAGVAAAGAASLGLIGCGEDDDPTTPTDAATTTDDRAETLDVDCVLTPEQTEGPYHVDGALVRRDITEDRPGAPLDLGLQVLDAEACEPIADATVEVWHADAEGAYSAFGEGAGETFLRGAQPTGRDGLATLTTIYPGWYMGRTVHVHVKVHVGGDEVHTGQLYFDDGVTNEVFERPEYSARGERDTTNATDGIYADGGAQSELAVEASGDGYVGTLRMGVQA